MECNEELIRLTDLLRIGVKTTRQIAGVRLRDRDLLLDIAERAEIMAQQLDAITGANTATVAH